MPPALAYGRSGGCCEQPHLAEPVHEANAQAGVLGPDQAGGAVGLLGRLGVAVRAVAQDRPPAV
jgi:hypothetical protein